MKTKIINTSPKIIYIDLDGKAGTDDIIIIGPKGSTVVDITPERREALMNEFKGTATFRAVSN